MKLKPEEMTQAIEDLLIMLESNLTKAHLMTLSIDDFFDKEMPSEKDYDRIISEFSNITTMVEIIGDYLYESRNAVADAPGTEIRDLVG